MAAARLEESAREKQKRQHTDYQAPCEADGGGRSITTLVNVHVDLLVFTRIAGTS